jgi:hypothetical protein
LREGLGAVAVSVPFLLGLTSGPDADHVAFRFQDQAITESSGLVVDGGLVYTTNDSGDSGRIFAVDRRTGETVGVTEWSDDPTDVEALAPAGPGEVWVADIGDNGADRHDIEVTRVPVGRGERHVDAETYELTYPGGPVDAETLLTDPRTGRLYVVSKQVFNGTVYAAPEILSPDGDNVLRPIGTAPGLATDGAFFPDGEHVIIRSYAGAVVYAWPVLRRVGSFSLPAQEQGEGLAVGPDDSLWLSSEGVRAPVLHIDLPAGVRDSMAGVAPSWKPSPTVPDPAAPAAQRSHEAWPWLLGLGLFVACVFVLVRSLRPH